MEFEWIEAGSRDAKENLGLDEHLLDRGMAVFRTWESHQECIVMGQAGQAHRDIHIEACERWHIPILKRSSGGGAVLLGPGCLNFSLVLPLAWEPRWTDVRYSIVWVTERMRRALSVPELRREGDSDLTVRRRKVSGSAQRRTSRAILHHGTLLYDFDASRAEQFLKPPHRAPHYRGGRSHQDFLGNLPLTRDEICRRLPLAWPVVQRHGVSTNPG